MAVGNSPNITLSEDDINGASLRGKTPSQLTIPELKRWLSCRKGARLSGKVTGCFSMKVAVSLRPIYARSVGRFLDVFSCTNKTL